jgi:hypothetical protein
VPKCKFRSYLLHQRQVFIVHCLWVTVGSDIYLHRLDYRRSGHLLHTVCGHLLYTVCGLQ